ncbi:MAG: CoA transferase, partial [Lawsonibacter sp.]|nr:CoA transferase [Lawsonibacter sp.]
YCDGTKTFFANSPVHFASIDPATIPCKTSVSIGGDTAQVLEELGYAKEKIAAMYEAQDIR